jgi:hypothetical protein
LPGADLRAAIPELTNFARKNELDASISAIGEFSGATLDFFDPSGRDYKESETRTLRGGIETPTIPEWMPVIQDGGVARWERRGIEARSAL